MEGTIRMRHGWNYFMRIVGLVLVWGLQTGATVGDPVASKAEKARQHYERGEYEEALQAYQGAQVENPDSPLLHFNVGDALFKMGDYETALKEFEQALAGEGENLQPKTLYNMGNALYQQQEFQKAVEAYRQGLELDSSDQDAKVNLELALERLQQQQQQQQNQEQQDGEEEEKEGKQQQQNQEQQDSKEKRQEEQQQDQQPQEEQQPDEPEEQEQEQQSQEQQQQNGEEEQEEEKAQARPEKGDEMSPEDAQRLLDALKDREKEAQQRRFRGSGKARDEDW